MDNQTTLNTLLSAWNAERAPERERIVSRTLADDFNYSDPHQPDILVGKRAFLDFLNLFRNRVKGVEMKLVGEPDIHHRHARLNLEMKRGRDVYAKGTYFADFTENGRIWRLVSFLDQDRKPN